MRRIGQYAGWVVQRSAQVSRRAVLSLRSGARAIAPPEASDRSLGENREAGELGEGHEVGSHEIGTKNAATSLGKAGSAVDQDPPSPVTISFRPIAAKRPTTPVTQLSFVVSLVCLTGSIGQRFYNQPELGVGSRAPYTIEAPHSAEVENQAATEARRKDARIGTDPVLVSDVAANEAILKQLNRSIDQGNTLRKLAGSFPYLSQSILSTPVQAYLRRCPNWEWRYFLRQLNLRPLESSLEANRAIDLEAVSPMVQPGGTASAPAMLNPLPDRAPVTLESSAERSAISETPQISEVADLASISGISKRSTRSENRAVTANTTADRTLNALTSAASHGLAEGLEASVLEVVQASDSLFNQAVQETQTYQAQANAADFQATIETVQRARQRYQTALNLLNDPGEDAPLYSPSLLELTDLEWQLLLRRVQQVTQQMLTQGIPAGLPTETIARAAKLQLSSFAIREPALHLGEALVSHALRPNLVVDTQQTRARAELAAKETEVVYVPIEQGEVIVRAGEVIDEEAFALLDYFNKVQREPVNWVGLLGFGSSVTFILLVYGSLERRFHPKMSQRDRLLLLLLAMSAPLLISVNATVTSLTVIGLIAGSFYGSVFGTSVVFGLGVLLPLGLNVDLALLASGITSGSLGAAIAGRLRSREELALLGFGVGFVQGTTYAIFTLLGLLIAGSSSLVWSLLLGEALIQGCWGLVSSILVLGVSPYLEHLFDIVTPIRLAELSNPNRPLLKRLAAEAPGTFQHTLFVATLAESAAKALNCNVELVRAGTLYHDIGKMHDPLGFVENQMGGVNKHDRIANPWISAQIIKKHVTEGLIMARKSRLPQAIQAFIPEHQGTMLIAYFYYQAKQSTDADRVIEADFRYAGPIPQSRETGIVMLADSCEAALRSLKDATYDEALVMVNKILRARWQDQQLVDSGLTRSDMQKIAEIFVQVWQQYHHKRIAYPKAVFSSN